MLRFAKRTAKSLVRSSDALARRLNPRYRAKRKYATEVAFWNEQLELLKAWFVDGTIDWWGIPAPSEPQKARCADYWAVNAVLTMHRLRPAYLEELQLAPDVFRGRRVLEVGCGPLAPIQQFVDCDRHGLDPLIDVYIETGWPLWGYDVTVVNGKAERMPYPDGYFDAVISVNALDHVDDFQTAAGEIRRILKRHGSLDLELEYHAPTVTEPQALSDAIVRNAFRSFDLKKMNERGKREKAEAVRQRFGLLSHRSVHQSLPPLQPATYTDDDRFAIWHGTKH